MQLKSFSIGRLQITLCYDIMSVVCNTDGPLMQFKAFMNI